MNTPMRVLYIDDSPHDRALVRDALEKEHGGFQVIEAASRAEFETRVSALDYQLVLTDFNILGFSGLQVLDAVHARDPQIPVVIVTGTGSEEVAVEAMKRGAADYVLKTPRHIQRLPHTLETVLEKARLVAERKQSEEALRQQAQIMAQVHDAIIATDLEGFITSWNAAAERMFEYSRKEALGKPVAILYPEEQHPFLSERIVKPVKEHGWHQTEAWGRTKSGKEFPIHLSLSLLRDTDGSAIGMVGCSIDITERKRAEESLRASEERYRTLVEQAADAIFIAGPDRRVQEANQRACEMFGYGHDEFIALPIAQVVSPADHARQQGEFTVAMTGQPVLSEQHFLRRNGSEFPGELSICRLTDGRLLGIVRDITERKRVEEQLRDYAQRVHALSRRIVEIQEEERRNLACELHDELGQVLTVVYIGLQSIGAASAHDAEQRLQECQGTVKTAIDKVRSLSLNLRPSMLDVLGLGSTLRWYAEQQEQRMGLKVHVQGDLGARLPSDLETTCFRVVQESLTNVTRHARARQAWIELGQEDEELRLVVRDDGVGFDVTAKRERARQGRSFGVLGMQDRVELQGGRFEIESAPGQGTTIRAHFPLVEPALTERET